MSLEVFQSLVIALHTLEVAWVLSRFEWALRLLDWVLWAVSVVAVLIAVLVPVLWWVIALCCLWCP